MWATGLDLQTYVDNDIGSSSADGVLWASWAGCIKCRGGGITVRRATVQQGIPACTRGARVRRTERRVATTLAIGDRAEHWAVRPFVVNVVGKQSFVLLDEWLNLKQKMHFRHVKSQCNRSILTFFWKLLFYIGPRKHIGKWHPRNAFLMTVFTSKSNEHLRNCMKAKLWGKNIPTAEPKRSTSKEMEWHWLTLKGIYKIPTPLVFPVVFTRLISQYTSHSVQSIIVNKMNCLNNVI